VSRAISVRPSRAYVDVVPRRPRSFLPDYGVFHITARGTAGEAIFLDDVDRHLLKGLFNGLAPAVGVRCIVWCFMTTHYHGVFETDREALSKFMHRVNTTYAQRFNERHERRGHLFEGRFSSWVVIDDEHLENTCAYVLNNPVRAGLCETAADWPWSWCVWDD
jgi:REP element-mobilizing transposase RayT